MAETHAKTILSHGKKSVDIIEFGKELFSPNSVVLMPGRGGSEDIATNDAELITNLAMSEGIAGLAASYKQFQFLKAGLKTPQKEQTENMRLKYLLGGFDS